MEFKEYMIEKKKDGKDIVISMLLYIAATIVSILAFMFLGAFGGIALLVAVGAFYGAHIVSARSKKEFEYICTEDNVDIDVIMNKSRRKRLISFNMKNVEIIASLNDDKYSNQASGQFEKTIVATSGRRDAEVYFAIVNVKGRTLVKFEPPYNMVMSLSQYARSKVHING